MGKHSRSLEDRILTKRTISDSGCWLWRGHKLNNGYGQITYKRKQYLVHRVSASLYLGLDLNNPKQFACHKNDICNNKHCFNPNHLYVGDIESNGSDYSRTITHCPQGHPYDKSNTGYSSNHYQLKPSRVCLTCRAEQQRDRRAGLKLELQNG